jgi:CrcB protein
MVGRAVMFTILVGLVGGLGAMLRFVADRLGERSFGHRTPWPIAAVNVLGSFAIGCFAGLALTRTIAHAPATLLTAGLCGGFTTFSTASVDTVRLAAEGRRVGALAHGLGVMVAAVATAAVGLAITS